jgi:hypothetical protein
MDEIAELADRASAMTEVEFAIEFGALTFAEQDALAALLEQRRAHGEERLEAIAENVRILRALVGLIESSGALPGTTLGEALVAGYITVEEVVEAIRRVPDPLARPT